MKRLLPAAFAALLAVQVLPAATLAWQQTRRLSDGRPVLLSVETRDPRDLFRGEYSVLGYGIGRLQGVAAPSDACDLGTRESCTVRAQKVYVRLAPDADGVHRVQDVRLAAPPDGELFITGTLQFGTLVREGAPLATKAICDKPACLSGSVTYGIENWYGPQGVPAKLDRVARKDVLVEARIGADGAAVLDAVRVGGTTFARTARLW